MLTTIAPADRVITAASFAPEVYPHDESVVGVVVTVTSVRDVTLPEALRFVAEVRYTPNAKFPTYNVGDVYSTSRFDWEYDDSETAVVYRFDNGETVTLPEALPQEVSNLVSDYAWSVLQDAADAYRAVLSKHGFTA